MNRTYTDTMIVVRDVSTGGTVKMYAELEHAVKDNPSLSWCWDAEHERYVASDRSSGQVMFHAEIGTVTTHWREYHTQE